MKLVRRCGLIVCGVFPLACGGVDALRFANEAPVMVVNDRRDTPIKPRKRRFAKLVYHADGFLLRRITRAMELRVTQRALDVNSIGEVPDSTWFTNRIGMYELSVEDVRRGPAEDQGPEAFTPWTIVGTKVGGVSPGFLIKDRRGVKYLLKFDAKGYPEYETAADVIVQRVLWACGFNVPDDRIVLFRKSDLTIAQDAVVKDWFGNKRPMTQKDLDSNLKRVDIRPDGRIRGLTSKYLSGIPIGGYAREGVRKDDPNDVIRHEDRRAVRGQYAIFSWLNHSDVKEENTLDMWVEDHLDSSRHYVKHYLVDFGKALGVLGLLDATRQEGFAHAIDVEYAIASLVSLGLWPRPWDGLSRPALPGVGLIDAAHYDPGRWKTHTPYFPFLDRDRFDGFWGAKIAIRFSRRQLSAIVAEARYSDPRSARYIVDTLVKRQRTTARYWFSRVTPVDRVTARLTPHGYQVCFDDLTSRYLSRDRVRYSARAYNYHGRQLAWRAEAMTSAHGRACLPALTPPVTQDGYTIIRLARRSRAPSRRHAMPPVDVHFARSRSGTWRVIGMRRH